MRLRRPIDFAQKQIIALLMLSLALAGTPEPSRQAA
jgi:hypothetical protein